MAISLREGGGASRTIGTIVTSYNPTGMLRMLESVAKLKSGATFTRAMSQGVRKAGNKTRTVIRKALWAQMGTKNYGTIVRATRSYIPAPGEYVIEGRGKGFKIAEFPVRVHAFDPDRWSGRNHWKVQPRDAHGRFQDIDRRDDNAVEADPWRVHHQFKRSFVDGKGEYRAAIMSRKKGRTFTRKLYGPAMWKEIVKDQSKDAFDTQAPRFLDEEVMREIKAMFS